MAQIPRALINDYTKGINGLSEGMRAQLAEALEQVDFSDLEQARTIVLDLMQTYCSGAADAAATLAARFYENARAYSFGSASYSALVDSGRKAEATERAVSSFFEAKTATKANIVEKLLERMDFEIKRAAGDCVFENGRRDGHQPTYARVPSGSETCNFCLMLASRGFVYTTKLAAGSLNHYHANCDCRIVPAWKEKSVQGYDPDALYKQWDENMDEEAKRRAELHGTTTEAERSKMMKQLEKGASKAKGRRALDQTGGVVSLAARAGKSQKSNALAQAIERLAKK